MERPIEPPEREPDREPDVLTIGLLVFFVSLILIVGALLILPAIF